ncbi:hypothetical protein ROG8370_00403 [Roseovarius gaetbuli]|uniref:NADH dehydrogenase subunit E n=1 Tax=Roseovarius gaetbuli TaxID=1356575 RepID=A0A1X6YCD1_9RHOB|nr:DUF5333 domain-containing protein [Roseovarius gaetbuli]SLN15293.1 hypothetical protein ROG8370_00403 [Roseovarius gaetbuli]
MRMILTLCLALGTTSALAGTTSVAMASSGKPPLREVSQIDDAMLWVALAIEISDKCPEIDPRTLKGLSVLYDLRGQARDLGYSDTEIRAYVRSRDEKARMRARGEKYVKSKGLNPSDPAALCTLGHGEIARSSRIGVLLKAK